MTARPDRPAEPLAATPDPKLAPMPEDAAQAEQRGRPPHGASDGKTDGAHQGGKPGEANFAGDAGAGTNAQTGRGAAAEDERDAPGISTDKKADDTR